MVADLKSSLSWCSGLIHRLTLTSVRIVARVCVRYSTHRADQQYCILHGERMAEECHLECMATLQPTDHCVPLVEIPHEDDDDQDQRHLDDAECGGSAVVGEVEFVIDCDRQGAVLRG